MSIKEFTFCPLKFDEHAAVGSEAINVFYLVPFTSSFQGRDEPQASPPIVWSALPSSGAAQLCSRALPGTPKCCAKGIAVSSCTLAPVPDPRSCAASVQGL